MSIEERIQSISERWFVREPLLFMTLMSHEITPNKGLRHLVRCGQGRIEYNFDYEPEKLSEVELEENLRAEVIRILLCHPYRHHGKKDTAYMASNITLNENYEFRFLKYKAKEIWKGKKFLNQNFEFYYRKILKMKGSKGGSDLTEQKEKSSSPQSSLTDDTERSSHSAEQKEKSSSQQSSLTDDTESSSHSAEQKEKSSSQQSSPTDDTGSNSHSAEKKEKSFPSNYQNIECSALWQEDDFMEQKIKEIIEWAHTSTQWGTLPDNLIQTLIASLQPEIDYRKVLSGFRASVLSSDKMLTRFRPSRRYGFLYMGKKNEFTTSLLIAVDVSGSISNKDIQVFYSVINRFFKYGIKSIEVLQFDCNVKKPVLTMKKAQQTIKVHGRGGTDFQPAIDYFEKTKKRYDGLIIFTDGYAPKPKISPRTIRKTLWICNSKREYKANEKWMKKCGRCCWVEK